MGVKRTYFIGILLVYALSVSAQKDYASRFFLGKSYAEKGQNELAMQVLLPLANNDEDNEFKEQAAYLYSVVAMRDSLFFQARQMLLQISTRYSYWNRVDEARLRLVICYFHADEALMALQSSELIRDEKILGELRDIKYYYLNANDELGTLRDLYSKYPNDEVLAYVFAKRLNQKAESEEDLVLLESLIDVFDFNPEMLNISKPDQRVYKDSYNVSLFLPFKYPEVRSKTQYDKNKFAYSFYAGVMQALDSLEKRGIQINLQPFDTEGDTSKLKRLLSKRATRESDLIIGPLFPQLSEMMMDFGQENKIIVVNPFSQNEELVEDNDFAYLFQTSLLHTSRIQAQFALDSLLLDSGQVNMMVMDKSSTDTAMAAIIWNYLKAEGKKIDTIMVFDPAQKEQFLDIYGDSSHIEDFSNMFVTNNNRAIIGRLIAAVEAGNSQVNILGHSRWLEYDNVDLRQMERRHVYFPHTDYIDFTKPFYQKFRKQFTFEKMPDFYAITGFELMMQFGLSLHRHGKYFQDALSTEAYRKGFIFDGIDYSFGHYNAYAPLMKVREGKIIPVGYRPEVKLIEEYDDPMLMEIDSTEILIPAPEIQEDSLNSSEPQR